MKLPSSGQRGPPVAFSSFMAIRKIGRESAYITWTPPCVNSPHKQRGPGAAFDTTWYCTLEPACMLRRKKNRCRPCSDGRPITPPLQSGRHCSFPLLLPSFPPSSPDKSVHLAGLCLSWGCQTYYSKGGCGLALGRANSGLKE